MLSKNSQNTGFTLVELLVVVAIIALLVSILLPSLSAAKTMARIVKAHAELRGITLALEMYVMDLEQGYPPTRFSCSSGIGCQLPRELAQRGYLPTGQGEALAVAMEDVFQPGYSYSYRAPGPSIENESTLNPTGSKVFVPDDFPYCRSTSGKWYKDPDKSPVSFAVWSMGPDPNMNKLADPAPLPLPRRLWCTGVRRPGVITHFKSLNGQMHMSP